MTNGLARLAVAALAVIAFGIAASPPAKASGCNGVVSPLEWGCAPWDNNNGPQYPHYQQPPPAAAATPPPSTAPSPSATPSASNSSPNAIGLKVAGNCAADPDPVGLLSSDSYADCTPELLGGLRGHIASALTNRGFAVVDSGADRTLTVTIRDYHVDESGGDFDWQIKIAADYQLTGASGSVLKSGSTSGGGGDDDNVAEQQFAEGLANALTGTSP